MSANEFSKRLERMPRYPAADSYDHSTGAVMLASNETPWAFDPAIAEAVARAAGDLNRYPDPLALDLRRALADRNDLDASRVAVGNGSSELLLAAGDALLDEGDEVVFAWPSFSLYPNLAAGTGAREIRVPLDAQGRHDLEAMAREVTAATRLVVVCNPNNPTATALPPADLDGFLGDLPRRTTVLIDEAYVEFSTLQDPGESLDLLERHPNLVLLRTFSKAYGLAGIRVGYALCSPELRPALDEIRQPFTVNALAQVAATEALRHQDVVEDRVAKIAAERLHVEEALEERRVETTDSQANFSWVGLSGRDEERVMAALHERGVVVRAGAALGAEGHLRVTYGTRAENDRFLEALDQALDQVAAA